MSRAGPLLSFTFARKVRYLAPRSCDLTGVRRANKAISGEQMRTEYDIRGGVRGKYYERYRQEIHVVALTPDVAAVFPNAEAVNQALRLLIRVARQQVADTNPSD